MFADALRWWLSLELLGLLALPLTLWFFRRLPDRGYSFGRPLGVLLATYGAWLLSMLGLGSFGRGLLLLVGVLVLAGGVALLGRAGLRRAMSELGAQAPWIVLVEVLFGLGLLAGIWMRWHDFFGSGVALQHTEQSMDLALLSGILSSRQFPPQDPWLAPYPINYYYLGYLLVATVIRLSGVAVGAGYTLGVATIWALTATGTAGLIYNMIGLAGEPKNQGTKEPRNQGTKEPKNQGTKEPRNQGTKEPKNQGTKEHGTQTTEHRTREQVGPTRASASRSQAERQSGGPARASASRSQANQQTEERVVPLGADKSENPKPVYGRAAGASLRNSKLARYLIPLLGVVFVLLLGNQSATLQMFAGSEKIVALGARDTIAAVLNGLGPREPLQLPPGLPADLVGEETQLIPWPESPNRVAISWWSSRAVWDNIVNADGDVVRAYAITEFPLFSFLLGDLHPHVLSLPWSLLALAVALSVLARRSAPELRARGGWVEIVLTGIVLGGLYMINSWDLPTYLLLYIGALTLLYLRLAPSPRGFFWPHFLQQAAAVVVASYLLFLPFHISFTAPTADPPIGIAPARTSLWQFGIMFGLFVVPLLAFVLREARTQEEPRNQGTKEPRNQGTDTEHGTQNTEHGTREQASVGPTRASAVTSQAERASVGATRASTSNSQANQANQANQQTEERVVPLGTDKPENLKLETWNLKLDTENSKPETRNPKLLPYMRIIPLSLLVILLAGILLGWPLFVLLPLALLAAWEAYRRVEQPGIAFGLWMFAAGALVVWGCDIVYLRDIYDSPRMNTIFKFYYQVWLLWGTASAFVLWRLLARLRPASLLWLLPTSVLLVSAGTYLLVAPNPNAPPREIDGLAYLSRDTPDEAAAVEWIRQNTPADAVIAMAPGRAYDSSSARISSATGRPAIVGWTQHESLWRGGQPELAAQVGQRERDLTTLFTSPDTETAQQTLGQYGARYVYVGANERNLATQAGAPPEALAKFDRFMSRVFEQGDVVLYQVR